jgi:uncharacterized protein (TIGR00369 family)
MAQRQPFPILLDPDHAGAYGQPMSNERPSFKAAEGEEIVSDSRCFVCGLANRHGLQVRFFREGVERARATCEPAATFMGYDGLLHGGVAAALLDEVMIKAVLASGRLVVTGRMTVQYRKPVTLGSQLLLEGKIVSRRGRLFHTEGVLFRESGVPLVTAEGTYVEVPAGQKERMLETLQPGGEDS